MKMRALVVSAAVMAVSSVASATLFIGPTYIPVQVASFSSLLDDTAPTYLRALGDGFGVGATLPLSSSIVPYRANAFNSLGGGYSFTSIITRTAGTGGWQQHLYTPSFDPAAAATNSISSGPTFSWTATPRTVSYNLVLPSGPITVVDQTSGSSGRGTVSTVVSTDEGTIPDGPLPARDFTFTLSGPGTVGGFESIDLRGLVHTFAGDLSATLSNGTISVPLFTRLPGSLGTVGSFSADFIGNYTIADGGGAFPISGTAIPTGTYAPQSPLSAFIGQPIAGTWTLSILDSDSTDNGRIAGFDLNIAVAPSLLKGDFNFDGEVLDSDISLFVSALTGDFASLVAQFPTRTEADFTFIGDFNGDGEVLDSDITGFVAALLGGGGRVTAIPEPAALGLLAPLALLASRRRR